MYDSYKLLTNRKNPGPSFPAGMRRLGQESSGSIENRDYVRDQIEPCRDI
jgi:hypothetical protein